MKFKAKMAVLLSTALLFTGCAAQAPTDETAVASVEQGTITQSTFNDRMTTQAGMTILLELVDKEILDGILPVTEEMEATVNATIDEIKNYYLDSYETTLKLNGFKNEDEFRTAQLLNEQRNQYIKNYIIDTLVTDEMIQSFYDAYSPEIEASHILIKPEDETDAGWLKAQETAKDLIKRIEDGEDFATLAAEFSADTGSAANGGALGSFGKGQMVAEFEEAAFALEVDEVTSAPVRSQFGFHIIKKTSGEEKKTLEEMKPEILDQMVNTALEADQGLAFIALTQMRTENKLNISDSTIKEQYELYVESINPSTQE